jgi:hypothetical protein
VEFHDGVTLCSLQEALETLPLEELMTFNSPGIDD